MKKPLQHDSGRPAASGVGVAESQSSSSAYGFSMMSLSGLLASSQDTSNTTNGSVSTNGRANGHSAKTASSRQSVSNGSMSIVGAFSGVKNMMNGLSNSTRDVNPQHQKHAKSVSFAMQKFRIQTPISHLGLVLTYSDSLLSPVMNTDYSFSWLRVSGVGDSAVCTPLSTPNLTPRNAWYPPSADDIGCVIRMRCSDTHGYGLCREVDSGVLQVDPIVASKVEEAVSKDRIVAKVVISSPSGENSVTGSSPSSVRSRAAVARTMSVDGSDLPVLPVHEFEVGGSIEVGSKGVLLCEKGVEYGGLRLKPSSNIQVVCCQPASFLLRVPVYLAEGSPGVFWMGTEEGEMCDALYDTVCPATEVGSNQGPSQNDGSKAAAGSLPSSSCDDMQAEADIRPEVQDRKQGVVELLVSCRDRTIRDSMVLCIRSMAATPGGEVCLTGVGKPQEEAIARRLNVLPWRRNPALLHGEPKSSSDMEAAYQHATIEVDRLTHENMMLKQELQNRAVQRTPTEISSSGCSGLCKEVVARLEQENQTLVTERSELQSRLEMLAEDRNFVGKDEKSSLITDVKAVAEMQDELQHLRSQCTTLTSRLEESSCTVLALQQRLTDACISAPTSREVSQDQMVFPVYEASSGEMVVTSPVRSVSSDGDETSVTPPACTDVPVKSGQSCGENVTVDMDAEDAARLQECLASLRHDYGNKEDSEKGRKEADEAVRAIQALLQHMCYERIRFLQTNADPIDVPCSTDGDKREQSECTVERGVHSTASEEALVHSLQAILEEIMGSSHETEIGSASTDSAANSEDEEGGQEHNGSQGQVDKLVEAVRTRVSQLCKQRSQICGSAIGSRRKNNESGNDATNSVADELGSTLEKCHRLQRQLDGAENVKRKAIQKCEEQISILRENLAAKEKEAEGARAEADEANSKIQEQEAAIESFRVSYSKLQGVVSTFKEKYSALASEAERTKAALAEKTATTEKLESVVLKSSDECTRLKAALAEANKSVDALSRTKSDMDALSVRLAEEKQAALAAKQNSSKEIRDLTARNSELSAQLSKSKERTDALESRLSSLQAETLNLSDARQQLSKQMSSYEALRSQIVQMRGQLVEADQEAQASRALLTEGNAEIERLRKANSDSSVEIASLKKTLEKKSARVADLKGRMEVLEQEHRAVEKDRNSLRKENNKLRGSVRSLTEDRLALEKLQPLYDQQLELLAAKHSRSSELENALSRMTNLQNRYILNIVSLELQCGILHRRCENLLLQSNRSGMCMEDACCRYASLCDRFNSSCLTISQLTEDLRVARTAEPFAVKKLNFMLSRLRGEKNHYENKAKSLSKDLQRKLLAGTPLQRELGRVSQRLEEVENERNAYRDAMVLACETYGVKSENQSW
eukprot:CAMPEP_0185034238 /NCGR_PEP_ID=MMETSP1103-20130426/23927_1 /TAXON_ID=36769 /ORGANISM="Paraphysomonas bandaiensis, Strain Caron Lab Isolate" /LENGTH=1383 /DNA_ID=CAMNT_0027570811 /DNA_START=129 /DNA_END=4277 /DNA_ORIENTATION=-